jgi:hypothetical protein
LALPAAARAADPSFEPVEQSKAFRQYTLRGASEFSKILYLIDRFKNTKVEVVYDGYPYPALRAAQEARAYLAKNYRQGDPAERWIKLNAYRSGAGNIIYFKYPDGDRRPMRDVLLEELQILKQSAR